MEGEGGFTRASWKRSRERGIESFVLNDYLSEQDRPILPNRDCPGRKKLPRGFTMFAIFDNVNNGVLKNINYDKSLIYQACWVKMAEC